MQLSEISLWGAVPLLLLFVVAVLLFWIIDRRLLSSIFRSFGHAVRAVRRVRVNWHEVAAVAGGTVVAVAVVSGLLMLCLPVRLLLPVVALTALAVCESQGASVTAYMRSFNNTQAHRYYMLANGASLLESLIPSLRRALRACVVPQMRRLGLPMALKAAILFIGLLMGGTAVAAAAVTTLMMCAAALVAVVVATLTTAFLLKKLNICC